MLNSGARVGPGPGGIRDPVRGGPGAGPESVKPGPGPGPGPGPQKHRI